MARGKQTCKILKEIRRQIAEANDIEFVTSECRYKGDCLGTCPKCEAEVRYLEQQLRKRQLAGMMTNLAGISAGAVALFAPFAAQSQIADTSLTKSYVAPQTIADTITIKGCVFAADTLQDGTILREPMIGGRIIDLQTGIGTSTDIDGNFQIDVCKGDSLEFSGIGYKKQRVIVLDNTPLELTLYFDRSLLTEGMVMGGAIAAPIKHENILDLRIIDENRKPIKPVLITRLYIDEDGEEDFDFLDPIWIEEKGVYRFYWDEEPLLQDNEGKPLKEVVLSIEVVGYDKPQTIKVKYSKRNTKKTIKFKHEKKK